MTRLRGTLAFLLIWAATTGAQPIAPVVIRPVDPTSSDYVIAGVQVEALCSNTGTATITGTDIRIDVLYSDCYGGPPPFTITQFFGVGPLPAGTYHLEAYMGEVGHELEPPIVIGQQTFVVTAAATVGDVPVLDTWSLGMLTVALAVVALLVMSRQ